MKKISYIDKHENIILALDSVYFPRTDVLKNHIVFNKHN